MAACSRPAHSRGGGSPAEIAYVRRVLHLRLISPADCSDGARSLLVGHPGVTNVVVLPGAGQQPEGDLLLADVARESASEVLADLRALGL